MGISKSYDRGLGRSLALYAPMYEATGISNTSDVAKPHHPILLVHAPTWTKLASGKWVLAFDGVNDYAYIPNAYTSDINFATNSIFTASSWVYRSGAMPNGPIFGRGQYNVNGWSFLIASGALSFYTYQRMSYTNNKVVPASTWSYVSAVFGSPTANQVDFFLNGDLILKSNTATHTGFSGGTDFYLGNWPSWAAKIADMLAMPRIWNRALSQIEIREIFNRERHLFDV